jgi:signal transduction histidine kinase
MLVIILENLLSNAWKYSVEGTKISIAVTLLPGAKANGETAPSDAGWTCFEISNEVAVDQVPDETRLFERYYRHSGVQGLPGMGIGLSLVQSAAAKLSSTVSYQSQGSHVFFKLRIPN